RQHHQEQERHEEHRQHHGLRPADRTHVAHHHRPDRCPVEAGAHGRCQWGSAARRSWISKYTSSSVGGSGTAAYTGISLLTRVATTRGTTSRSTTDIRSPAGAAAADSTPSVDCTAAT